MTEREAETLAALHTLFEQVAILQNMHIAQMLDPARIQLYDKTLQVAYDALVHVEDALSSLGDQLEYEHWRLGGALEEIQPLIL